MSVRILFERELQNRGLRYTIDIESGRHAIEVGARQLLVSLDNLQRDVERDGDTERVSRFVDSIAGATSVSAGLCSADRLYWCVEPNDYEDMASFRVPLSDRVDRALVHLSADGQLITWATPDMLEALGLSESDASSRGFTNLARRLTESTIEYEEVDGVQLGFIDTRFPSKLLLYSLRIYARLWRLHWAGPSWPSFLIATFSIFGQRGTATSLSELATLSFVNFRKRRILFRQRYMRSQTLEFGRSESFQQEPNSGVQRRARAGVKRNSNATSRAR